MKICILFFIHCSFSICCSTFRMDEAVEFLLKAIHGAFRGVQNKNVAFLEKLYEVKYGL